MIGKHADFLQPPADAVSHARRLTSPFFALAGLSQAEGGIIVGSAFADTKATQAQTVQRDKVIQTQPKLACLPNYAVPVSSQHT